MKIKAPLMGTDSMYNNTSETVKWVRHGINKINYICILWLTLFTLWCMKLIIFLPNHSMDASWICFKLYVCGRKSTLSEDRHNVSPASIKSKQDLTHTDKQWGRFALITVKVKEKNKKNGLFTLWWKLVVHPLDDPLDLTLSINSTDDTHVKVYLWS